MLDHPRPFTNSDLLRLDHGLARAEAAHLYGGRELARTITSNDTVRTLLPGDGDLEVLRHTDDHMGDARSQTPRENSQHRGPAAAPLDRRAPRRRVDSSSDRASLSVTQLQLSG